MRKTKYLFIGLIAISLMQCVSKNKNEIQKTEASVTTDANSKNDFVAFILKTEPKVKDAVITEADVLYLSVVSDGTKRDGLAQYFCQLLKDKKINEVNRVKIIEYNTQNNPNKDNAYGILLGESYCK